LGDCCNAFTHKTGSAANAQASVLVYNLSRLLKEESLNGIYNGYSACPLIIGRERALISETGYDLTILETFNPDTGRFPWKYFGTEGVPQKRFAYFLDNTFLPFAYWNFYVKGLWYGPHGLRKPDVTKADKADR
jgi:sulfide:quinone oxidoreductase